MLTVASLLIRMFWDIFYVPCKIKVIFFHPFSELRQKRKLDNCRFFVYLYESNSKRKGSAEKLNILPVQNQLSFGRAEVESLR